MSAETIARWQFGITTVYHFFFVPITISLSLLVAVLQTMWVRSGNLQLLRLTKWFGKLFLINFAMGVVTGIVQEFQFGMNWSEYSRFVGDVFGAPLALEALIAFFMESTFLGLWIFGWDRLPKKLHLATIWAAAIGSLLSASFILAANSWMQNPVGASYRNGRAELVDFTALLTNPVFVTAYPHVIFASFMTGGALIAGVCGLQMRRLHLEQQAALRAEGSHLDVAPVERNGRPLAADEIAADLKTYRFGARFGAWVLLVAAALTGITGDLQGKTMVQAQPMKMAAAEALYHTQDPASFSILTVGTPNGQKELYSIRVPHLLSFLSTGHFNGRVLGIDDIKQHYAEHGYTRDGLPLTQLQREYAPTLKNIPVKITPTIPVTYWAFRYMIGLGMIGVVGALWILWALRKERPVPTGRVWLWTMRVMPFMPVFGISFGWIFTEMGRQPWIVAGVLPTWTAVSPGVSTLQAALTMGLFTLLYGVLAVVEMGLLVKYQKAGLPDVDEPVMADDAEDKPMSFAY